MMAEYRLYFLNPDGRIWRAIEFECRDDKHAIETVAEHCDGTPMELWQFDRLVESVKADRSPLVLSSSQGRPDRQS